MRAKKLLVLGISIMMLVAAPGVAFAQSRAESGTVKSVSGNKIIVHHPGGTMKTFYLSDNANEKLRGTFKGVKAGDKVTVKFTQGAGDRNELTAIIDEN